MVGVLLPTVGRMAPKRLTLGYAEVEVTRATPLGPAGTVLRGHEFHASRIDEVPERSAARLHGPDDPRRCRHAPRAT